VGASAGASAVWWGAARAPPAAAIPRVVDTYKQFFLTDEGFIGGPSPTIADIRLASTLEFLSVADADLPDWVQEYRERVEAALGDAYTEPAADVRGYIAQATGQAVAT
jgi:glutathione S-transferase